MFDQSLEIIKDIGHIIAATRDPRQTLQNITAKLARRLNVDVCTIYIFDQEAGELVLAAAKGFPDSAIGNIRLAPGKGITGVTFTKGKLFKTNLPQDNEHFINFPELGEERLQSILSAPIKVAGQVVGVLNLETERDEQFPREVVNLIQTLSPQLGNVIMDQQLFHSLNEHNGDEKRVKASREMQILSGKPATTGVSTGHAITMDSDSVLKSIYWKAVTDIDGELALFERALDHAKQETIRLEQKASSLLTESDASIFYSHLLILDDIQLLDTIRDNIREGTITKFALKNTLSKLQKQFAAIDNDTIRERLSDITDVILRLIHSVSYIIQGEKQDPNELKLFDEAEDKLVVVAHELYPSQLISWPLDKISGIVCETGGPTSHVAIIARALRIPALMGVRNAVTAVRQHDQLIVDCHGENVYIRPTDAIRKRFTRALQTSSHLVNASSYEAIENNQQTSDGVTVNLQANISLISELPMLKQFGASGVGLYRTEFLYMVRTTHPSRDEQCEIYEKIAAHCEAMPLTIRLLDVGGDKPLSYIKLNAEQNPLLGNRGIRLLLSRPEMFRPHLEAILMTTWIHPLRILIPMVTQVDEVFAVKAMIDSVKAKLEKRHNKPLGPYKLGIMIETPSIVWDLEKVLKHIDFVSIGSNDLIQYTFAIDRNDDYTRGKFSGVNPITIRFLQHITDIVKKYPEKEISLCGELAGQPEAIPLLLGAGLRTLSMSPWLIPGARRMVKQLSIANCETFLAQFLKLETQDEASAALQQFITDNTYCPLLTHD